MKNWFRKTPTRSYDPELQEPVVRRSICTGEMTVGFLDKNTGRFREYECVHTERELEAFCKAQGIRREDLKTIY